MGELFCHYDRILSLGSIAGAMGGKVRGNKVVCPGPEDAGKRLKWKQRRRSLTVYLTPDGRDIRVNCWHPADDYRQAKDWVRSRCGIVWKPKRRAAPLPPFKVRNQFFGETLRLCRNRGCGRVTLQQFQLLINDCRPRNAEDRATHAWYYGVGFGFDPEAVKQALAVPHRTYTASERAKIFQVTYAERQQLGLRRTGSIDLDKAGRERARRDRYNVKRRAIRAARVAAKATEKVAVAAVKTVMKEDSKESVASGGVNRLYQVWKGNIPIPITIISYSSMGITKNPSVNRINARKTNSNSPQIPKIARAQGP